ncbi:MAG TPA: sugar phosphate isomerase/epimerase [Chthoniobacteraceae bacterium]|nr:sugar phosphate isomerase/epimerase [Chthoniobacteraceae bacterium]
MKFGICNEIFQDWPLDETFAYAAKVGYEYIEIAPFTIAKSVTDVSVPERKRIKDLAAQTGIGISGIHWVLVQTEGLHLTHPDDETRARTSRYFVDLVDFCGDLSGKRIIVGSPKQRSLQPGVSYEQAWEYATNVFRDSVRRAEDRGVVICFEPLGPGETDFVNTAAEGIRFAEQFNSPAMSIILDVKAMSTEGRPVPQIIRESAGKFEYFHANDPNLKGPGFGDTDFVPIGAALRDANYGGVVSVEVFKFEEGAEAIASRSIEYLRRTFAA